MSGSPCTPPEGWSGGEVYFGLYDSRVDYESIDVPDKGEASIDPDEWWSGQLTVPEDAEPGSFGVYANCWAEGPDGFEEFDAYEFAEFTVG